MARSNSALMRPRRQNNYHGTKLNAVNRNNQEMSGSTSYGIVKRMKGIFGMPMEASSKSDHYGSYSGYEECDNGISLGLLLSVAAGLAAMLYALYTKVMLR